MREALRRRCGFTLVELLVVMGIIAVLGAMLMPVIFSAITKVREGTTRMEINSLSIAMTAYQTAFGEYPPDNVANEPFRIHNGTVVQDVTKTLNSAEALVFYLSATFRTEPQKKGEVEATKNVEACYEFEAKRLWDPGGATYGSLTYDDEVLVDHMGRDDRDAISDGYSCFYRFRNNDVPDADRTPLGVADYYMGIHKTGVDIWSPGRDGIDCIYRFPDKLDSDGDKVITKDDLPFPEYIRVDLDGDGDDESVRVDEIGNW